MAKMLILKGNVQGVFCREYCQKNGEKLGLSGSASNLDDGTVQVLLRCDDIAIIGKYIDVLKSNPHNLRFYGTIDSIETTDYQGNISGDYNF